MTTGTTPPAYSSTYGRLATVALTQGWSVSHRNLTDDFSLLTAQRGNTTLTFLYRQDDLGTYRLDLLNQTQLLREGQAYVERSQSLTLGDALEVLAA